MLQKYKSNLIGGFGNQLFIIFQTIAKSLKDDCDFEFYLGKRAVNISIGNNVMRADYDLIKKNLCLKISDKITEISPANSKTALSGEHMLEGYMQKGFCQNIDSNCFENICKIIGIREYQKLVKDKHKNMFDISLTNVSIHFRYGDFRYASSKDKNFYLLNEKYYSNSIKLLLENNKDKILHFYIFYEKEEEEINNIIKILVDLYKIQYTIVNLDILPDEQMIMQSLCNHNIIANSTYSLWSAMLNTNPNKQVYYPSKNFSWLLQICKNLNFINVDIN